MRDTLRAVLAMLLMASQMSGCAHAASGVPLRRLVDIPLPGKATRFDYQSLDVRRHMLFIAHLGDGEVTVVDTRARRVIGSVADVEGVHGVLAVPELHTVYASATGTNELVAIDDDSLKIKARTPAGDYPDGIAFDPRSKRLFVSDEHGGTDSVVDARTNRNIGTIALGGEIGNTQYDSRSGHIFVNAESAGQLVEIDPEALKVIGRTALPGCRGNHGLLIDERNARAFVACEDNAALLWLDMRTMRIVKTWTIGDAPDVLAGDERNALVYASAESGVVSIFANEASVTRLAQGFLASGAHTVSVDPDTGISYWPLENVNGRPVLRIMEIQRK